MPRRQEPPPAPPPRRSRGSGSLTRRADRDAWLVRYRASDGTSLSRTLPTREAAEQQLAAWRAADQDGAAALADRTLEAWVGEWLTTHVALRNRPSTQRIYRWLTRDLILPTLGALRIADITPQHVRRLHRALVGRVSPRTVTNAHNCLRRCLQVLVDDGALGRNPCSSASPPPAPTFDAQPLSLTDARRLLDALADEPWGTFIELLIWTGLRVGEAGGLRWSDVDLERGLLHVQQQIRPLPPSDRTNDDWWYFGPTKSGKPRRVPLSSPALAALERQRERVKQLRASAPRWRELGLVFVAADGTPAPRRDLTRTWDRLRSQLSLGRTRLHDLRHTTASLALDAGAQLIEVSRLLGHSSVAITDQVYAGLLADAQRRVTDRLADHLERAKSGQK